MLLVPDTNVLKQKHMLVQQKDNSESLDHLLKYRNCQKEKISGLEVYMEMKLKNDGTKLEIIQARIKQMQDICSDKKYDVFVQPLNKYCKIM